MKFWRKNLRRLNVILNLRFPPYGLPPLLSLKSRGLHIPWVLSAKFAIARVFMQAVVMGCRKPVDRATIAHRVVAQKASFVDYHATSRSVARFKQNP